LIPKIKSPGSRQGFDFTADAGILLRIAARSGIAVDALEPTEGDLASVPGKRRYRLEPFLEAAGILLVWNVSDLPDIERLEPSPCSRSSASSCRCSRTAFSTRARARSGWRRTRTARSACARVVRELPEIALAKRCRVA